LLCRELNARTEYRNHDKETGGLRAARFVMRCVPAAGFEGYTERRPAEPAVPLKYWFDA